MRRSRASTGLLVVMSAVALGFGTIFGPKANADDHWSASPKLAQVVHARAADSGDSFGPRSGGAS